MIFFDMDGVLDDFNGFVDYNYPGILDMIENNTDFWNIIYLDRDSNPFWEELKPIEKGLELFDEVSTRLGIENIAILTAYPSYFDTKYPVVEDAIKGKKAWIADYLGDVEVHVVRRRDKANFSTLGSVLIDDWPKNIREWNARDGVGILFTEEKSMEELYDEVSFHALL